MFSFRYTFTYTLQLTTIHSLSAMKTLFASALVVVALLTTFNIHQHFPVAHVIRWIGESSASKEMPFEWKHAYAGSSLEDLEQKREDLRYQWAAGEVRRQELESTILALEKSIQKSKANLETLLQSPETNQVIIKAEIRAYDRNKTQLENTRSQLLPLTQTMKDLDSAEAEISKQILDINHRLQMVQLNHAKHQAHHAVAVLKGQKSSKGSMGMLSRLENQERIESEYLKRFGNNDTHNVTDTNMDLIHRAREIVQSPSPAS